MKDEVIPFGKGIHREPSVGTEGELSECVNLWSEGGEMKLLPELQRVRSVNRGWVGKFVHDSGNEWSHLILTNGNTIGWVDFENEEDEEEPTPIETLNDDEVVYNITAIGNVLVITTNERMLYFMWVDNEYKNYSFDELEDADIQFALEGDHVVKAATCAVEICSINTEGNGDVFLTPVYDDNNLSDHVVEHEDYKNVTKNVYDINGNRLHEETFKAYEVSFVKEPINASKTYCIRVRGTEFDINLQIGVKFEGLDAIIRYSDPISINKGEQKDIQRKFTDFKKQNADFFNGLIADTKGIEKVYMIAFYTYGNSQAVPEMVFSMGTLTEEAEMTGAFVTHTPDNITMLLGSVNNFMAENGTKKNMFAYPFFVRYAYKLSDGTFIKPSAPVLMIPNSAETPSMYVTNKTLVGGKNNTYPYMSANFAKLQYKILNTSAIQKAKEMDKVVKGIAIAVTSPIYTYNSSPNEDEILKGFYCSTRPTDSFGNLKIVRKDETRYMHYDNHALDAENKLTGGWRIIPSYYDNDKIIENVENASVFRVVSEIPIEDIAIDNESNNVFTDVEMDKGVLDGLNGRQVLDDNTSSLKKYYGTSIYPYNSRLTMGNIKEELYKGYAPQNMTGFLSFLPASRYNYYKMVAEIDIVRNGITMKVRRNASYYNASGMLYFYYPDADAKNVTIYQQEIYPLTSPNVQVRSVALKKHKYLNGAFWFGMFESLPIVKEIKDASLDVYIDTSESVYDANKVISTLVNNPFVIDASTASQVGIGQIIKLISNTKALSQGQFGQHPVFAFCTDGIWAMSVGNDGKYMAVQPISRDVAISADKILQLDDALAFVSNKGLMLIDGSKVSKMCQQMDSRETFPHNLVEPYISDIMKSASDDRHFAEIVKNADMMWDSENSLIWIYAKVGEEEESEEIQYNGCNYVVSVKTGEVFSQVLDATNNATRLRGPESIIHGYPYSYVQYYVHPRRHENYPMLMTYKKDGESETMRKAWFLTRPISFGDAYTMKMLYDMKVEKFMGEESECKVAVFVSNDRKSWSRLKSLKARSYKWYRFALFCNMNDYDRLTGMICRIDTRRTDKLR